MATHKKATAHPKTSAAHHHLATAHPKTSAAHRPAPARPERSAAAHRPPAHAKTSKHGDSPTARPAAKRSKGRKAPPGDSPAASGSAASSAAASGSAAEGGTGPAGVRVRMYRVGFGDFFLVSFPAEAGPLHVLIDCGVFKGTSGEGDIGTIESAVENLVQETGGHLALVVMTHRHADHIIGFSRCKAQFQKMKVDAVWMPVWEKEYDDKAQPTRASHFQANLTNVATAMHQALVAPGARPQDADHEQTMRMLMNATGPLAAAGGGTNAASLDLLKRGFKVTPEYYAAGDTPTIPPALAQAGLTARILGPPPVDDISFMKLMDLKKGVGQYLTALSEDDDTNANARFTPFEARCEVPASAYPKRAFSEWEGRVDAKGAGLSPAQAMQKALSDAQPASLLEAAKTLDSFLNNQSLVILFGFQGKKLLFVGDAQAGNWEHWLYSSSSPDKSGAAPVSADSKAILGSIDFYKVGHHGSTNATPKAAVEALRSGIVAMCSTQPGVYGSTAKGTEVPRAPLIEALEAKVTVLRSDDVPAQAAGSNVPTTATLPALPKGTAGELGSGEGWVDYVL